MDNKELIISEFLLFGIPIIGAIVSVIINVVEIMRDQEWYEICPGRERCGFDKCMRHSLYGCPVSPNGEFLTEEERKELKKLIDELD